MSAVSTQRTMDYTPPNVKEGDQVTVCVAAMCTEGLIVCASDRMLTAGDVEFEPNQPKLFMLTSAIGLMTAGDMAMQAEILNGMRAEALRRVAEDPKTWLRVGDMAELYSELCSRARQRRAEAARLRPLGLDSSTFLSRQRELDPALVQRLAVELLNFETPPTEAIIAGIDTTGPHIYAAYDDQISCADLAGFVAIGSGGKHASSQMMFSGHTRVTPFPETLLSVYSAKRRSEVAPGVGEGTDVSTIGPQLGQYASPIPPHVLSSLDRIYLQSRQREERAKRKAETQINEYFQGLIKAATTQQEQKPAPDNG